MSGHAQTVVEAGHEEVPGEVSQLLPCDVLLQEAGGRHAGPVITQHSLDITFLVTSWSLTVDRLTEVTAVYSSYDAC
jgi:hypothetical protein